MSQQDNKEMAKYFFRASAADFKKIPGSPVAYWASNRIRDAYKNYISLGNISQPRVGMRTGDNDRFLRFWHEVSFLKFNGNAQSNSDAKESLAKWFPFVKGGEFRKWS